MSVWEKWKIQLQISLGIEAKAGVLHHIWDEFHQALSWYIRRFIRDRAQAEDILQEVMLQIYEHLDHYDSRYALSTWIYTITRNHCLNHLSKKSSIALSELQEEYFSRGSDPEQEIIIRQEVADVESFLEALPLSDREIAFLRFYQEMPYQEMAELTGVPEGTLKYRVHAIRKALKKYLGDKYE